MDTSHIVNSLVKRFLYASALWFIAWPVLYFIKIGDITGVKAWFWTVGALNFPVAAIAYLLLDSLFNQWFGKKPWLVFAFTVLIITLCMPFYYQKYGFALGVTIEARYL